MENEMEASVPKVELYRLLAELLTNPEACVCGEKWVSSRGRNPEQQLEELLGECLGTLIVNVAAAEQAAENKQGFRFHVSGAHCARTGRLASLLERLVSGKIITLT
ncbi:MAG: hypothetical protein WBB68_03365 [Candidatus Moraniibacteriota bacterium]